MTLEHMEIGVVPYSDGSGYRIIVSIQDDQVTVKQDDGIVILKDRNECAAMMDAIDALWQTRENLSKLKD